MTCDQLMRRAVGRLRAANEIIDHAGDDPWQVAKLIESALADLHEAAAKLPAVRREIGEPEDKP